MTQRTKTLPNGRARTKGGFSLIPVEMQEHVAFQSLPASALRVLAWCLWKNYQSSARKPKGLTWKPTFRFTNSEARKVLNMNQQTFTRAKDWLAERGFIKWERRGGLKGVNGVPSEFSLSGEWKNWRPTAEEPQKKSTTLWQES